MPNAGDYRNYRDMNDAERVGQLKRDAAYNNRWAVPDHQADLDR